MDEEIILPENKMYIVMTPIGEDQFNIICIDKMQKPINELYYINLFHNSHFSFNWYY